MNTQTVLDILHAVETGEKKITLKDPLAADCGNVDFLLDDGTVVTIFKDEGVWDYVDTIILPDGTRLHFWGEDRSRWEEVRKYRPPAQVIEEIYLMEA